MRRIVAAFCAGIEPATHGRNRLQSVHRCRDIVGSNDARTVQRRNNGERHATVEALAGRTAREFAYDRLARQSYQHRQATFSQLREPPQQLEIVLRSLAEAETGVDDDALGR